jgi:Spy/CpxP family protein refolding chaperone
MKEYLMKKTIKLLLIAAVALSVALAAYAGNNPEKTGCKKDAEKTMLCECFSKLNLTEKQKEEITALKKSFMEQEKINSEEMSKISISIEEMANADKPDMALIDKKIEEHAKLFIKGKKEMVEHMLKVKALLTPEQIKLWKEHKMTCGSECKDKMKHECKGGDKDKGCKGEKHEGCKHSETEKTDK